MADRPGRILEFSSADGEHHYDHLVSTEGSFTFVVDCGDGFPTRCICLVGIGPEDSSIDHVALADRGHRVASYQSIVRLSRFLPFRPLSISELVTAIPARVRRHAEPNLVIPPGTWRHILAATQSLRPETQPHLDSLRRLLEADVRHASSPAVVFERDSVALALTVSRFDRRAVASWVPPEDIAPFLTGLPEARVREDLQVQHDTAVFGDWSHLRSMQVGTVVFAKNGERLTVMNVNRTPIESTLGVDLVYYHHKRESFVMVQYKRMRKEGDAHVYRPDTDSSHEREIERMSAIEMVNWDGDEQSFRLHDGSCFIKLCPETLIDPASSNLTPGMYLPLDYWRMLCAQRLPRGRRGGLAISFTNTPRYLTNTDFIALVEDGWVGSRGATTESVAATIRGSLESGRSVVLAAHST